MAWSWSHTNEAYAAAERNVRRKKKEWLEVVYAEWRAAGWGGKFDSNAFDQRKYDRALAYAKKLPDDVLADTIWEWMSEYATCDNGGFNAYTCPSGCGCHTVAFDDEIDEDNDDPRAVAEGILVEA